MIHVRNNNKFVFFFSERFGLYYVNFSDPARPRKRKASVGYFKNILKTKKLPKSEEFQETYLKQYL